MSSKKHILLTFTIYRSGEKIIPIIPELCKEYDVDVLTINQMSIDSPWFGDFDPRLDFYEQCQDWGASVIQGPGNKIFRNTCDNPRVLKDVDFSKYKTVLVDDNIGKWSWGGCIVLKTAKKAGCVTIGSPHGNHEFSRYDLNRTLGKTFDHMFVLGKKEQDLLANEDNRDLLIPGGIPANDALKQYKRSHDYILVIAGYSNGHKPVKVGEYTYKSITEDVLTQSGIMDLSKKYNKRIVIKEKSKFKPEFKSYFKYLEKKYPNIEVVLDCKDDNQLIAGAAMSISAPSTMCFKSIQMGIPTVLLKGYGMTGNFEDYDGLVDLNKRTNIEEEIQKQISKGKDERFLRHACAGGHDFSSTSIYVDNIRRIVEGV